MLGITRSLWKRLSLHFNNKGKKKEKIFLSHIIQIQSERQEVDTMWEEEKEGDSDDYCSKQ